MRLWRTTKFWGALYIENIIIDADYPCLLICKTTEGDWVLCSICDTEDISYLCMLISPELLCKFLDGKHIFRSIIEQTSKGILYVNESGDEHLYKSISEIPSDFLPDADYCFQLEETDSFFHIFKRMQADISKSMQESSQNHVELIGGLNTVKPTSTPKVTAILNELVVLLTSDMGSLWRGYYG